MQHITFSLLLLATGKPYFLIWILLPEILVHYISTGYSLKHLCIWRLLLRSLLSAHLKTKPTTFIPPFYLGHIYKLLIPPVMCSVGPTLAWTSVFRLDTVSCLKFNWLDGVKYLCHIASKIYFSLHIFFRKWNNLKLHLKPSILFHFVHICYQEALHPRHHACAFVQPTFPVCSTLYFFNEIHFSVPCLSLPVPFSLVSLSCNILTANHHPKILQVEFLLHHEVY